MYYLIGSYAINIKLLISKMSLKNILITKREVFYLSVLQMIFLLWKYQNVKKATIKLGQIIIILLCRYRYVIR